MFDNRKRTGVIIGAAIVAAIGGSYLYFRSWTSGKALTPLEGARLIPENALIAAYFSTDLNTWNKLSQFGSPEAKKLIAEATEPLKESTELENIISQINPEIKDKLEQTGQEKFAIEKFNYQEDIEPWLGNIMLAALPTQTESQAFLAIGIKDKVAALQFMDKFKKEAKQEIETTEYKYKGVKISEIKSDTKEKFTFIFLDSKLIAGSKEAVEKAIDTYQGSPSFADKKGTEEILTKTSSENSNTIFQFYLPNYSSLLQESLAQAQLDPTTSKSIQEQFDYFDSMLVSVGIADKKGILIQSVTKYNSDFKLPDFPNIKGQVLAKVPQDSLMVISSGGISNIWSWFVEEFGDMPEIKEGLAEFRDDFKENTNLDLDKDIIGWMNGEFAISILARDLPLSLASNSFVNGAIVINTSDRPTAENTIATIENLAKSNNIPFENKNIAGKKITEYPDSTGAENNLAYGWLDDKSFAITIGDKTEEIFSLKPSDSLARNKDFQATIQNFPKQNNGYFYLNFKQVNSFFYSLSESLGQPVPPETKAILDSFISIAGVSSMPDKSTLVQELLIELETNNKNSSPQ